ncbi:hypothetical protein CGZ95_01405 [Enemella evansiae]|nr:hypothetical protein CGZ95_01405 [Enemella evansiae]
MRSASGAMAGDPPAHRVTSHAERQRSNGWRVEMTPFIYHGPHLGHTTAVRPFAGGAVEPSHGGQLAAPMTRFIGRRSTVPQAEQLVREHRLVSLTGPGGIGKTRLALELAGRLGEEFADGHVVVALDVVTEGDGVAWRAASALEITDLASRTATEQLTRFLSDRELLLVLDNCEHLLSAAAELVLTILTTCPGVRVLTTSREPLGLPGEHVLGVPPLQLPDPEAELAEVAAAESVVLLLERAEQAGGPVRLTEANRAEVGELVRRLDGMPLALELAAVRLRSLSPGEVLERLDSRYSLLRGTGRGVLPRHQTLRGLVDWSYELCTPAEQLLWARMSVFAAGCDLAAAEAVAGFGELRPEDVLDLLDSLVAKSIVIAEHGGLGTRYRQLVTIRDYGAELAEAAGETAELRRRHRDLLLTRTRAMLRDWVGPDQQRSLALLRAWHADAVLALEWSLGVPGEAVPGAELASLLRFHWVSGRFLTAGWHRLARVLDSAEVTGRPRAEVLWVMAWVTLISGHHDETAGLLREAAELAEELDDDGLRGQVHNWGGLLDLFTGDAVGAVAHYREADRIFTASGDLAALGTALFQRALSEVYGDSPGAALATCERLIALSREHGETWFQAYAWWVRGLALTKQGDLTGAREAVLAALGIQADNLDGISIAHLITLAAQIAVAAGDPRRAARLHGLADRTWHTLGTEVAAFGPGLATDDQQARSRTRQGLSADAHREALAWGTSHATDHRAAVAGALAELGALTPPASGHPAGLTRREAQIAELVADGLSNKEIGARLTISPRTVDGHVEKILHKFDVHTRAQVAVRMRQGG